MRWAVLDPPAEPGSLGLSLTALDDDVVATWIEAREAGHRVRMARSSDGEWSEPNTVIEADDLIANWADFPRAARGGDGALYVHFLRRSGTAAGAYEIQLARSKDDGRTFASMGVVHRDGTPTEHGFVSMVPIEDGIRLFWLDGRATLDAGGATAVYSALVNEAIGMEQQLDDRACDCCQTDAALTGEGPVVAFRDRTGTEDVRDISVLRFRPSEASHAVTVHNDGWEIRGCPVNGPAIDADGSRVAVAWFTGAEGGAVRVAFSEDGGASFGDPIDVDARQPPGRVDLVLVDDGAAISWLARTPSGGEVRVRFVSTAGRLGAPVLVGRTGLHRASGFPVMTRTPSSLYVGYRDEGDSAALHVARLDVRALPRAPSSTREEVPTVATVQLGDALPDAVLRRPDDSSVSLSELAAGDPLLLAFFAGWCQPCREELASLETLRRRHDTLHVVAVGLDEGSAARIEGTARSWGYEGEVLRDGDVAGALGVPPLPGLFLFDAAGVLRLRAAGELLSPDAIERALAEVDRSTR